MVFARGPGDGQYGKPGLSLEPGPWVFGGIRAAQKPGGPRVPSPGAIWFLAAAISLESKDRLCEVPGRLMGQRIFVVESALAAGLRASDARGSCS
ncbi:hypothetical protein A7Q09_08165 [Methylacidiphilum sp. Yel]|nr:hypothetical protein A7Q09_08165 [Methylacidiphilum sp. Yel]